VALLTKEQIVVALQRLGELARAAHVDAELMIFGGGVMVLDFGSRNSTRDVDALILSPPDAAAVRQLAVQVATEMGWPSDWLNDAVKGFVVGPVTPTVLLELPGLRVTRPAYEQLLAMKLCAWRDDVDVADARQLLAAIPGTQQVVWSAVEAHLQAGRELVARYAFDDLWEEANRGN
jgi:hypothetical protein